MNLFDQMASLTNVKETENNAVALSSTKSHLLDLFGMIGAMRDMSKKDIINTFIKAYSEDKLLTMRTLFYARDCRGGLGERETPRMLMEWLAKNHKDDIELNLELIPEYGRFDDLYAFVGTPLEEKAFSILKKQFEKDLEDYAANKPISNCAKWLKSCNTSSMKSRALGRKTAKAFGLTEKEYRQKVSMLRGYSNVIETKMSAGAWDEIEYSSVPSYAALRYSKAFERHDSERYGEYLESLKSGNETINSATLFPYDLVSKYTSKHLLTDDFIPTIDDTVEEQWKALPDYVSDGKKFLVMADVSGSMAGRPMATSVGLAIYFAERNTGPYHGKFLTFTNTPALLKLPDNMSLAERVSLVCSNCGFNTNLEAAFQLVLEAAFMANAAPEDLPDAILVISDMEIDEFGDGDKNMTFTKAMKKKFAHFGYKMPVLVYWNVAARHTTFHAEFDENVRFVSGNSAAVFKGLCENLGYSAADLMVSVLNSERYSKIKVS